MREEIFFDLDTNKELEGTFFHCNTKLIDAVFALLENGYTVIDCKLRDASHIYLKESDITAKITNEKDIDTIIHENEDNNEYRRITYRGPDYIKYDSYTPNDTIEIKLLGHHEFSNIPEGFKVYPFEDCTVIKIKIDTTNHLDEKMKKLDVWAAVKKLETWIESITGKKVNRKEYTKTSYGNSEYAIDPQTKQIIPGNYVLLDSLMVPIISELRKKGYNTLGCCSGHHDNIFIQNTGIIPNEQMPKTVETWIVFSNEFDAPTLPEDAKYQSLGMFVRISYSCDLLNSDGTYKSASEVKKEIEKAISKLFEWAKSLPYANGVKHSKQ